MIELDMINQVMMKPTHSPKGESGSDSFLNWLQPGLLNQGGLKQELTAVPLDTHPEAQSSTIELLKQWQNVVDTVSASPHVEEQNLALLTTGDVGISNNVLKQAINWGGVGSYQTETCQVLESVLELDQQQVAVSTADFVPSVGQPGYLPHSDLEQKKLNILMEVKGCIEPNISRDKIADNKKITEMVSISAAYGKTLELVSTRRFTQTEYQGTRTLRIRDYFTADANLEYAESFAHSDIDRLMVNGYIQWEKK